MKKVLSIILSLALMLSIAACGNSNTPASRQANTPAESDEISSVTEVEATPTPGPTPEPTEQPTPKPTPEPTEEPTPVSSEELFGPDYGWHKDFDEPILLAEDNYVKIEWINCYSEMVPYEDDEFILETAITLRYQNKSESDPVSIQVSDTSTDIFFSMIEGWDFDPNIVSIFMNGDILEAGETRDEVVEVMKLNGEILSPQDFTGFRCEVFVDLPGTLIRLDEMTFTLPEVN